MDELDEFFARKDRKKSKTSKKFTTTEEMVKKLEDANKKQEKPVKKERPQEGDEAGAEQHEQDEWRDFEEEKKDYTGLKIGNLTLNQEGDATNASQDSNYEQQQMTYDESGNEVEKKVGPWKRLGGEGGDLPPAPQPVQEKKQEQAAATPHVVGGSYVPPNMRNQSAQSSQQPMQSSRLRSKVAPDIHNEEFFPTLASTKEQKRGRNEASFEMVSHSKSNSLKFVEQSKTSGQVSKLSLGNRYNTLSNDS